MEVIIKEEVGTRFEELHYGTIFAYKQYHCMKIYDNHIDDPVGLILDEDCSESMETIPIDLDELIYRIYPNSKIIIE